MLWLTKSTVRPCLSHIAHLAQAFALEFGVAHRQHLIDHQDLRFEVRRHRKSQAQVHPARIALDRRIDELPDLGKVDDLIEFALDLRALHAQDGAVEIDVLAPGQLGVEAGAHFQQRANPPVDFAVAFGGVGDAREDLEQGALAGPVAPDDAEDLP